MIKPGAVSISGDPPFDGSDWETNSSLESSLDEEETKTQKNEPPTKSSKDVQKPKISAGSELNSKSRGTPPLDGASKVSAQSKANETGEDENEGVGVVEKTKENVVGKTPKKPNGDLLNETARKTIDVEKTNSVPAVGSSPASVLPEATETQNDSKMEENETPHVPKQGVVKKVIKVKKKKLRPRIDVIETTVSSCADLVVGERTPRVADAPPSCPPTEGAPGIAGASDPTTVECSPKMGGADYDPLPAATSEAQLRTRPAVDAGGHVTGREVNCRDDKAYDSSVASRSLESSAEAPREAENFGLKLEAEVLEFLSNRKIFDDDDDDDDRRSPARDFRHASKNYTHEADDDDDDIIENITKYLDKKLSRGGSDLAASKTTHEPENEFEDSDGERPPGGRSLLADKATNQRAEAGRGRDEAFMDQVRRERTAKSSRQRRNSLYQPRRRWETDERVAEKTKHARALVEKQSAVVESMSATVQKFAELEALVRELKAESLEQRAELDNLEDLFDIVYSKHRDEISAAAEALRKQKRNKREKVSGKSELNSMLQEFFGSRKQTPGVRSAPEGDAATGKFAKPSIVFSFGKDDTRDDSRSKRIELTHPEHKSSANPDANAFNFSTCTGDTYLTRIKTGDTDRQTEADQNDRSDLTSLSAAEFIERIRNKYDIGSPKPDQKVTGGSFLHKLGTSQVKDDLPRGSSAYGLRRFSSFKAFNGAGDTRGEFENPFKRDGLKAEKMHPPEQAARRSIARPLQATKH